MSDAISSSLHSLRHFSDPATYEPYHVIWGWSQWKCGWGQIPLPEQQQHVNEVAVIPHWPWLECLTLNTSFRLWEILLHVKMTCPSIHQQTDLFTFCSLDVSHVQSVCCHAVFKNVVICTVFLQAISCVVTQNMSFMVTPCINNIQHFNFQLMHTMLKNVELLKHFKIRKTASTCYGLQGNHHQGATVST